MHLVIVRLAMNTAPLFSLLLFFGMSLAARAQNSTVDLNRYGRIYSGAPGTPLPVNIRDLEINSPKSVRFSADSKKIYINSLEGGQTLTYSWPGLKKGKTITHSFGPQNASLFRGERTVFDYPFFQQRTDPNTFRGKPVESELSHDGRYLWVTYYRRDYDASAQSPSAVAIIDTRTDEIVRVMPTGPIPKYVVASPDGKYVAIIHWGDNTIGLIDTGSGDPRAFRYVAHLAVEGKMSQSGKQGTDRDVTCGYCLRGAVFTNDGQYLLVARMGGGGIAGFHIPSKTYLGSIMNMKSTPRHLVLSPNGKTLYMSANISGFISSTSTAEVIRHLEQASGRRVSGPPWKSASVGSGARTVDISSDGQLLFVAVNHSAEVVVLHAPTLKILSRVKVDPYAVGLALAPDNSAVIVTAQGRKDQGGGNSVNLVRVDVHTGLSLKLN